MNKEKLIQEVIEFIEGKIDIKIFYENYKNGKYDELFDVYLGYETIKFGNKKVSDFLNLFNVNTSRHRVSFFNGVKAYLFYEGYSYVPTKKYEEEWSFRVGIQPSYVLIEDDEILNKYINEAPEGLKKTEKKKWIKNRIKQDFKYDKTPPRWVQDPEWPIVDGIPLVFKKQSKMTLEDERVFYTFYHPETKEETVVIQFY